MIVKQENPLQLTETKQDFLKSHSEIKIKTN